MLALVGGSCSLPDLDEAQERPLAQTSFLYAADGSLITPLHGTEDRVILRRDQIPDALRDATIAIEDRRFYDHHGVDLEAIGRAAIVNLTAGEVVEGGSTITQQLVKLLYIGDEETFARKRDEAVLAWQLEDRLTKDQILTRYLNTVYFGRGAYGAQAAANTYFGIDAIDLSLAQSALLAGLISAPNHFDPFVRMDAAIGRRNVVLRVMEVEGMLDRNAMRDAKRETVRLRPDRATESRYPYPHFVDHVKAWFMANPAFGETRDDRYRALFTGGLSITTTLDPVVQEAAADAVRSVLSYPGDPDGAVTVIDPRTGFIRAMVGGDDQAYWADRNAGRVNLATGMGGTGRQTGSAFKPFALVAALEHGISPDTAFSAPASLDLSLPDGTTWSVTNAGGTGYGTISLRSATINSVNTVYAQLIQRLTPEVVTETATRMGMRCCPQLTRPASSLDAYPAAVLGANESNTLEMASAYGTLASGGKRVDPIPVMTVTAADGTVLWQADPRPKQVVHPQIASAAIDVLGDAVSSGTGASAAIGRPQFGKTGTDDGNVNAWFVGAIPQLSAAVWVGFHEGQIPMVPPRTRSIVYGGTYPAQIWRLLMLEAIAGLPVEGFPTPQVDYVEVAIDTSQVPPCLPNPFTLPQNIGTAQFIVGTEPTAVCVEPQTVQDVPVPSVVGLARGAAMAALEQAGFYVRIEAQPSTQPLGTVIWQTPTAGTYETQTGTIVLTVAAPLDG